MSFIDDQISSAMMEHALGYHDDDECEYDDRFILARRQSPDTPGGVDWRYEKGGVFSDE